MGETFVDVAATFLENRACVHGLLELKKLLARGEIHVATVGSGGHLVAVHGCLDLACGLVDPLVKHKVRQLLVALGHYQLRYRF